MNEGDASYLRARAEKYRRIARDLHDEAASEGLKSIADAYDRDADAAGDRPHADD